MESFTIAILLGAVVDAVNGEVDHEYPQEISRGARVFISSDSKKQADKDVQGRDDQKATMLFYLLHQLLHLKVSFSFILN